MPNLVEVEFINDQNKNELLAQVLFFLEEDFNAKKLAQQEEFAQRIFNEDFDEEDFSDWLKEQSINFDEQNCPRNHFWHNKETITAAFNSLNALVALNEQREVVGYLIWQRYGAGVEIDILETFESNQGRGIGKTMLNTLAERLDSIYVLTGKILQKAQGFFQKMGWVIEPESGRAFNIIRPGVEPRSVLPNGCVIAICAENFFEVKEDIQRYQSAFKYFQITYDKLGVLSQPIISPFKHEGYIAIYFNKEMIAQGRAKDLFEDGKAMDTMHKNVISISTFKLRNPELLCKIGYIKNHLSDEPESTTPELTQPLSRSASAVAAHGVFRSTSLGDNSAARRRARTPDEENLQVTAQRTV